MRIAADKEQPSVAIEIPLMKPLPDYDMHETAQPTPRDIDALLVSQGFRDLVDDARGVLMELLSNPPVSTNASGGIDLDLTPAGDFEIAQLTGAICPGDDEVYRPGLWIVLKDRKSPPRKNLSEPKMDYVRAILHEFVKRLNLT